MATVNSEASGSGQPELPQTNEIPAPQRPASPTLPQTPTSPSGAFPTNNKQDGSFGGRSLAADVPTASSSVSPSPSLKLQTSTPPPRPAIITRSNSGGINTGSQSPGSPARSPSGGLDIEGVLRQYAGDMRKALEAMISERNSLTAQNNQLWKLMDKSRSQGAIMFKEAERMRSERDRAVLQLSQMGISLTPSPPSSGASGRGPSNSSSGGPGSEDPQNTERGRTGSLFESGSGSELAAPPMTRHHSDSTDRQANGTRQLSPPSNSGSTLLDTGSNQTTPRRGSDERGLQLKNPQRKAKGSVSSASGEPSSGPSSLVTASSAVERQIADVPAHSLNLPMQPAAPTVPPPPIPTADSREEATEFLQPSARRSSIAESAIATHPTGLLPPAPIGLFATPITSNRDAESRMSFEPDVKHYLAAMSTPEASPQDVEFPPAPEPPAPNGTHQLSPVQEVLTPLLPSQSSMASEVAIPPPFAQPVINPPPTTTTPGLDGLPTVLPVSPFFSSDGSASITQASPAKYDEVGTPEPKAPFGGGSEMQNQQRIAMTTRAALVQEQADSETKGSLASSEEMENLLPREASGPQLEEVKPLSLKSQQRQVPVRQSSNSSTINDGGERESLTRPPSYETNWPSGQNGYPPPNTKPQPRRLPQLTAQLLPYVRCQVTSSTITTNALGKDVLCFVISVTLRPPGIAQVFIWSISKLFSTFIDLDTRIKTSLGGKKEAKNAGIVSLPDGKTWKDFAPSKIDQRKATLESYMQSLLTANMENKDDICQFLQSDFYQAQTKPAGGSEVGVSKSGYLTKKGKSLGGWKTRFFVLEGSSLHYFEARGGAKLGTIPMLGAQIGRQHKSGSEQPDDKSYRHAFLIIEAKRLGAGSQTRHVLCAQSDEERDSWVEVLIRHVHLPSAASTSSTSSEQEKQGFNDDRRPELPRVSTSSSMASDTTRRADQPVRKASRDDVPIVRGPAQPIANLPQADSNSKLFQNGVPPSVINAREDLTGFHSPQSSIASTSLQDPGLSASLPKDLERTLLANQEQQRYEQARPQSRPGPEEPIRNKRQSMMPPPRATGADQLSRDRQLQSAFPGPPRGPRVVSTMPPPPERLQTSSPDRVQRDKISGPSGGVPIPQGFKFGAKGPGETSNSERERKAKSGRFWGFGGTGAAKPGSSVPVAPIPRPVFGVHLEESLQIAQVAGLPAIVFRCIQYLEASGAAQEEGIFRLSGSSAVIKGLRERFNVEGDIDLLGNDEKWDLHAIAGLLKLFLRELPTSLLTRELHMKFLAVMDLVNSEERVSELSNLVAELPEANYTLLRALTSHLILVIANASVNKMTMRNIGVIFSPTLGIPAGIFSELVSHFQAIFDDEDSAASPDFAAPSASTGELPAVDHGQDDESVMQTPRARNRNSRSYAASGVDKLLGTHGRSLPADDGDSDTTDDIHTSDRESTAPSVMSTPIPGITLHDSDEYTQVVTIPDQILSIPTIPGRPSSPGLPASPRLDAMMTPKPALKG